jgi:hypothetical protein
MPRHAQVHQHDVRRMLAVQRNGFRAVRRLGDDLHVGLVGDHRREAGPHDGVVVDGQHANGHAATLPRGP